MVLDLLAEIQERMFPPETLRLWDRDETFPEEAIRELLGPEIGLQLLFIPQEYGGMGGGARDIAAVSETMAKICLGVATGFLAIHLGTDPILVGATPEQKEKWLGKLATQGAIVAYAVTEPEAGSNLQSFNTTATPVTAEDGAVAGYRINGTKQFISNGGYADFLTVLAETPEGPSFFIVEKGTPGFTAGKPEDKHGIRSSNTAPLVFDDVFVPAENLVGGVPGKGLVQANEVFGYTRLMVACFGLGGGVAALQKVIAFAKERIQFGSPLLEKQGYTHKLVVPYVTKLEAARAYIEEVAERLDSGESDLQVEGAIAKLFASDTGNACADAAIQALGGYGYIRDYDVEKIKRDVKITTIYEGTSEIQQLIISTFRWRSSVQSKYGFYENLAAKMDAVHAEHAMLKADVFAGLVRLVNRVIEEAHKAKATRQQYVMFHIADLATVAETGAALILKAAAAAGSGRAAYLETCARVNTALAAQTAFALASEILYGTRKWDATEAQAVLDSSGFDYASAQAGIILDMDALARQVGEGAF
jgi:alkylation response protein AidB-like acyl-CoA dehydrogenase